MNVLNIRQVLETLCGCAAPSGYESPAAEAARELLGPLVDEVSVDRMNNLLGVRRCGQPGAKKLLLDAHLDEIGLMVTGAEEGFLRFCSVGGVDPRMLPDREVLILSDPPIPGVVVCQPPHLQAAGDQDKAIPISDLWIDAGLTQAQAEALVGVPMVFREGCAPLGEGQVCGKSLDDRSCFAVLLRALELLKDKALDVDLYVMGRQLPEDRRHIALLPGGAVAGVEPVENVQNVHVYTSLATSAMRARIRASAPSMS